jgi:ribose transport system permease protein
MSTTKPLTESAAASTDADDTRAVKRAPALVRWLGGSGSWVLLLDILLVVVFTILSPDHVFWSVQNLENLLLSGTVTLLLSLGIAMLLGAGAIDLSVGANLVLSSVVGASVIKATIGAGFPVAFIAGLAACLATGVVFGLVNSLVIAYFDVNSLIATLGTTGLGLATALLLTGGSDIGDMPAQLQADFGLNTLGVIPIPAIVAIVIALLLWGVLRNTRFGTRTLAIGSLRLAAERSGLKVRRHLTALIILTGILAGLAGFIDLSHYGATTISGHPNDSLAAITAVVIGGTRLEGGKISIGGTVWGTALSVILQGGLVIIGVPSFWQLAAVGLVLIVAVCLDRIQARRRSEAR